VPVDDLQACRRASPVMRVLELSGFGNVVKIFPDTQAALASFAT
jgi:hypothetical protein